VVTTSIVTTHAQTCTTWSYKSSDAKKNTRGAHDVSPTHLLDACSRRMLNQPEPFVCQSPYIGRGEGIEVGSTESKKGSNWDLVLNDGLRETLVVE
jgi:hypothetical protein